MLLWEWVKLSQQRQFFPHFLYFDKQKTKSLFQDNDLLHKLTSFLDTISGKNMKKWVDCIIKIVQRRLTNDEASKVIDALARWLRQSGSQKAPAL
jgi:flagellin-specific chaperone FliS